MSTNSKLTKPNAEHLLKEGDQVQVRVGKLEKLIDQNDNPYKNGFTPTEKAGNLKTLYAEKSKEELESLAYSCSVAGRVMAVRDFGKASFLKIRDASGVIQLYVQKDSIGEEAFAKFRELDLGDIVFSEGKIFKTKTGELSIHSDKVILLTKSLRPLPEKFHGLSDVEARYRQRYLDLITSEESRAVFEKRSKIIEEVRKFLLENGFMEVETPMMHPIAGGAAAKPFITHHNALDMKFYLRIAPELYLKRLIVGGFEKVFEINRNFRNEGVSIKHSPEFTMLEFYQAYATYEDLMDFTEKLFARVAQNVCGTLKIDYQGTEIDLSKPWKRLRVEDAVLEHSGFKDAAKIRDEAALRAYLKSKDVHCDKNDTTGKLVMKIFDEEVEKLLIQPTFLTQYPSDVSPLSRRNEKDPYLVDRFEAYIYGREMGNAFSELNDPIDQRERFLMQVDAKAKGDEEANDMDEDYVNALEYGMPPTAGEGLGIDRLVMFLTNSASIRDVVLFPHMRSRT